MGPGRGAGLEPRPLPRHAGAGPRLRAPREDARIRRDQADARRHGVVPRSAPAPSENDAGDREGPDRGGAPGGSSRHRPRAQPHRREGSRHARRDGACARRARPLRRVDPRRDEEPPGLLHPDDGHLRVPGGHAGVRRAGVLRPARGKGTPAVRRDAVPLSRLRRGVRAPLSELSKRPRAPAGAPGKPGPPPRGGSPRRARHRHVGLPGTRRLDRDGPVRQGRPLSPRGDPRGDGDRRALARPREGPRDARTRQARRPAPPRRRPPRRREERPRHLRDLQGRPSRRPRSTDHPIHSDHPIDTNPPILSCAFAPSSRSSRRRPISSPTRSGRCRGRLAAPSPNTRRRGRRAACAPGRIPGGTCPSPSATGSRRSSAPPRGASRCFRT